VRVTLSIEQLGSRVHEADELLAQSTTTVQLRRAMARLEEVDAQLAQLVADDTLIADVAVRVGRLSDELSSHLLAAAAMDDLEIRDQSVADLLQRGVRVARAGIDAVDAATAQFHLPSPSATPRPR
jgi:hypothetical protein